MKPNVIALVATLVSGSTMYSVGALTADRQARQAEPAAVLDAAPVVTPAVTPAVAYTLREPAAVTPVRTVTPSQRRVTNSEPVSVARDEKPRRSWGKTALIIGGSAASGAGVGAAIGGKKGAITGAAIGGGAASIYEAIKR